MYRFQEKYLLMDSSDSVDAILSGDLDGKRPCFPYGDHDRDIVLSDLFAALCLGLKQNIEKIEAALKSGDQHAQLGESMRNCHKLDDWVLHHINIPKDTMQQSAAYKEFLEHSKQWHIIKSKIEASGFTPDKYVPLNEKIEFLIQQGKINEVANLLAQIDEMSKVQESMAARSSTSASTSTAAHCPEYADLIETVFEKIQGYVAITPQLDHKAAYSFTAHFIKFIYTTAPEEKKLIEQEMEQWIPENVRSWTIEPVLQTYQTLLNTPLSVETIEFLQDLEKSFIKLAANTEAVTCSNKTEKNLKIENPDQTATASSYSRLFWGFRFNIFPLTIKNNEKDQRKALFLEQDGPKGIGWESEEDVDSVHTECNEIQRLKKAEALKQKLAAARSDASASDTSYSESSHEANNSDNPGF